MNLGLKAYFEHVNAQGGVHGRKIDLRTRDDRYEPELAAENTRKLIQDERVFALVGYVGTPTTVAALPALTAARVPLIGPYTGAQALRNPLNRYVFNVRASYFDETERLVEHLVLYQNDNFGKDGLAGVEHALARRKLKLVAVGTVERNSTDVEHVATRIAAHQPDAVIMISAYASVAAFVRQMKKAGSAAQFLNVSFVGAKALADALGEDGYGVVISQVVPFPWSPTTPVVKEYQEVLAKAGITDYNFSSLEGFIVGKVFVEALRRAGKDPTREGLIAALEALSRHDIGGFPVSFSTTEHQGSTFVDLSIIGRGGKFLR
jgi:ABC-type branched-subunit amino acid transport system substrate-binding protein